MNARQEIRDAIAEARRTPDKEPFDIQKFCQVYDVTADIGESPLTPRTVEEYEEQYYLLATGVKTLEAFAEYRRELGAHDAG